MRWPFRMMAGALALVGAMAVMEFAVATLVESRWLAFPLLLASFWTATFGYVAATGRPLD